MIALESCRLFSRLNAGDLKRLKEIAQVSRYGGGELIFKEGDPGDGMYLVGEGQVQISAVVGQERKLFSEVAPGDVFGEMAVLDDQPRSACASAAGETAVYFLPRKPLLDLLHQSTELAMLLTQEISGRLREFNRQYVREVLQAERMALVGRFASSIVHDLKNPLTIISIAADMGCAEQATLANRKLSRERIEQQVKRITHMVNDIIEFTRGASTDLVLVGADYATYVRHLVSELQQEVSLKKVALEYDNEPPAVKVRVHPHRLSRVFYNLVGNAVDAMSPGGTIKLRFELAGHEVRTTVQDSGTGIPAAIEAQLFEPFVTYGKARGTGLGLSITRRIVEEHGGRITARNRPEGGAAFTFSLPLAT